MCYLSLRQEWLVVISAPGGKIGFHGDVTILGGSFKYFLIFNRKLGEMIQFDLRIFFKWMVQPPTSIP